MPIQQKRFAYSFMVSLALLLPARSGTASSTKQAARKSAPVAVKLVYPNGLALNQQGELYISDIGAHRVLKLNRQGRLLSIAGTGEGAFGGDGGPAIKAQLSAPHDLIFDTAGNLLIADTFNQRIRRIDRQGVITTLAGNGKAAYAGDNGSALQASLNNPQGLAFDRDGNLLIADTYNHVVRRVDGAGTITTFAGTVPGHGGDGGPASRAQINLTMAVAAAADGSVYISDAANSRIRRVAPDGVIQTIVGYGPAQDTYGGGYAGDGGPAAKPVARRRRVFHAAGRGRNPPGCAALSAPPARRNARGCGHSTFCQSISRSQAWLSERRRLQQVALPFACHVAFGQPAQFLVEQRRQDFQSRLIATVPGDEQLRDFMG